MRPEQATNNSARNQLINMPIIRLQLRRHLLRPTQAESAHARYQSAAPDTPAPANSTTLSTAHRSPATPAAAPPESAFAASPANAPPHPAPPITAYRRPRPGHRASRANPTGRFQALHLPFRRMTAGRQQRQPRALAVGIVEHLRQQAFGIAQRLMTPGRGRGIDDHQPQFMGATGTQVEQHIAALTWPAIEQGAGPVDRAAACGVTFALLAVVQPSCAGSGIRPRIRSRANA